MTRRGRVHCLKHDLESLLLAAPDGLRQRLGTTELRDFAAKVDPDAPAPKEPG